MRIEYRVGSVSFSSSGEEQEAQNVTEQKTGLRLPATATARLMRQLAVKEERGLMQMLHDLGERWTPRLKAHLLCKTQTKSHCLQQDQDKRQCPELLLHFKVPSFGACGQLLNRSSR